jgi:hypothetical protein
MLSPNAQQCWCLLYADINTTVCNFIVLLKGSIEWHPVTYQRSHSRTMIHVAACKQRGDLLIGGEDSVADADLALELGESNLRRTMLEVPGIFEHGPALV